MEATPDLVERIAKTLTYTTGGVVIFMKMFKTITDVAKEKSVGAAKIIEFVERFLKVEEHITKLEKRVENREERFTGIERDLERQDQEIAELRQDNRETLKRVIEILKK